MADAGSVGDGVTAPVRGGAYPSEEFRGVSSAAGGFGWGRFFVGFGLLAVLIILVGLLGVLYYVYAASASEPSGEYSPLGNVAGVRDVPVAAQEEAATTSTVRPDEAVAAADPVRVRRVTEICQAVYSEGRSDGRVVCRNITVWEDPETGRRYSGQYNIVVH